MVEVRDEHETNEILSEVFDIKVDVTQNRQRVASKPMTVGGDSRGRTVLALTHGSPSTRTQHVFLNVYHFLLTIC